MKPSAKSYSSEGRAVGKRAPRPKYNYDKLKAWTGLSIFAATALVVGFVVLSRCVAERAQQRCDELAEISGSETKLFERGCYVRTADGRMIPDYVWEIDSVLDHGQPASHPSQESQ